MIYYSEYGAVGDGAADDFDAIIKAHEAANETGAEVRADAGAVYYIGGAGDKTAQIQTDTDWSGAKFIIDDTKVPPRNRHIFNISSKLPPVQLAAGGLVISKNQAKLDLALPYNALISVTDNNTRRYIREGLNQNNGAAQTDIFIIDSGGNIDMNAPVIWDFDNISAMTAYPVDSAALTVKGGHFTTIANRAESKYTYYSRGISITRSNVILDGVYHAITGELEHGAPYAGFISVSRCANILVQNCMLSGHKTYTTIGSAGKPVTMGTYDVNVGNAVNITFKDCKQINDIHDTNLWGIFGSNYSKNLVFDGVTFSRFDAHEGVANAAIRNSVLGHMGVHLIGCGTFLLENTKAHGYCLINLRSDYGSTWEGEIIIRNCEFIPRNGVKSDAVLISGSYSGQHDFGYTCYMPRKITIDGLLIDDSNHTDGYNGPKIFADFNRLYTSADYKEKYPYVITEEITVRNLEVRSGKDYLISNNPFMFRNVNIKT